jgi:hypothetical protein
MTENLARDLPRLTSPSRPSFDQMQSNRCGGITYKFCARIEMMSSVAD